MNGMAPLLLAETYGGPSYLTSSAFWAEVGVCRLVYRPFAASGMLVCISTGVKVRYWLVYEALTNVQVGVFGNGSAPPAPFTDAEWTVARPEDVPHRLSATIIAHPPAAQNGQDSAPLRGTSG